MFGHFFFFHFCGIIILIRNNNIYMVCSSCGQEVADTLPSCPHCGKIFTSRPQDDSAPTRPAEIVTMPAMPPMSRMSEHVNSEKLEVHQAVKQRRKQRWFFYVVIIVLFLGAVGLLVKTYNDNTALINQINGVNTELKQSKLSLTQSQQQLDAASTTLSAAQTELATKAGELEKITGVKANLVNVILQTGLKMDKDDLKKIPYAKATVPGPDADADGLADEVEAALGTDKALADTDNDGYTDLDELLRGYNPLGTGNLGLNSDFANKYKGRLILQEKDFTSAWYVGYNGERYYLGSSVDNFAALLQNEYWSKQQ